MNVLKLRGKMVEKGLNVGTLAAKIGIDKSSLYRKLKECEKITVGEAQNIKDVLGLTAEEAREIFFD